MRMLLLFVLFLLGGCAAPLVSPGLTPVPTLAPQPTLAPALPKPLPTTALPSPASGGLGVIDKSRADLASRLNVDASTIKLVRVEERDWPDASLGCPQPGMQYAQVITPGSLIVLEVNGKQYEYHAGRSEVVFCEP